MTTHPHPSTLSVRPIAGPHFQASKWQKCPVLIDVDEMEALIKTLEKFSIFQVSGLIPNEQACITISDFLESYAAYITALKEGRLLEFDKKIRAYFYSVWTTTLEALYAVPVNETQCLVKVEQPVVQLQAHRFDYSSLDETFHSMVMGEDHVTWGIQFSYPHLFQDHLFQVHTVKEGDQFPNTALFKDIQRWVRAHTIATPFLLDGKKQVNVPIRLGKNCLSWINRHPQLQAKHLQVIV